MYSIFNRSSKIKDGATYDIKPFTYVSLFSGVGGFEQALNKLGGSCVMASEFDKFAEQAYQAVYGHATKGDVTKIDANDVPDHDLLVGGFPCQTFSTAGNRAGFEDTRGTLFFDIIRIAAEKKPKAILLENVKGLVNHDKGNTLDVMIQLLNDTGYVVDFDIVNSKYFGVPQNRERIYIVAIRDDIQAAEPWGDNALKGSTVVPKGKRRLSEWAKTFNFAFPLQEEVSTRLRDVLESDVDSKYYLPDDVTANLVADLERKDALTDSDSPDMVGHVDIRGNDSIKRTYSPEGVSPTLTTMQGGHQEPKVAIRQGEINYIGDLRTQEAVKPESYPAVYGVLSTDGIGRTLDTQQGGSREIKVAEDTFEDSPKYRIRKLTPLECFRLQAFPDDVHETLVEAGLSDSQRYKMAGNAVTVSVVEAIAEQLLPIIV